MDNVKIQLGLNSLLKLDGYLLANNLNERTITHKLAEYYQGIFYEWNVDCEYNRNLGGPKDISIQEMINGAKIFLQNMANTLEGNNELINILNRVEDITTEQIQNLERQLRNPNLEYIEELDIVIFLLKIAHDKVIRQTIYPDIIIHHRGTNDNNIVIEVKKTINTDREARAYDLIKLITLVTSSKFHYKRGYFIDLPVKDDFVKFKQFATPNMLMKDIYKIFPK